MEKETRKSLRLALNWFDPKCPECNMGLSWGGILTNGTIRCVDCKEINILVAKTVEFSKDGKTFRTKKRV